MQGRLRAANCTNSGAARTEPTSGPSIGTGTGQSLIWAVVVQSYDRQRESFLARSPVGAGDWPGERAELFIAKTLALRAPSGRFIASLNILAPPLARLSLRPTRGSLSCVSLPSNAANNRAPQPGAPNLREGWLWGGKVFDCTGPVFYAGRRKLKRWEESRCVSSAGPPSPRSPRDWRPEIRL